MSWLNRSLGSEGHEHDCKGVTDSEMVSLDMTTESNNKQWRDRISIYQGRQKYSESINAGWLYSNPTP